MSILGDLGSGVSGFFSGVQTYATAALIILILLGGAGFYIYFNYAQNKIQIEESDNAKLNDAFNTEKSSLTTLQADYKNLLTKLTAEQNRNNQISKANADLQNKLSSYDYLNNAKTNSTTTQSDVNSTWSQLMNAILGDSDPNQFNAKAPAVGKTK